MRPADKPPKTLPDLRSLKDRQRNFEKQLQDKIAALENRKPAPAPAPDRTEPQIGDKMPDGTIYAGISPDTGRRMYATPPGASLTMPFNEAVERLKASNGRKLCGHEDWRVPTKNELNVLFNNRAAIGGFNESGSSRDGWYWSTASNSAWGAWCQRFSDGHQQYFGYRGPLASLRLVR